MVFHGMLMNISLLQQRPTLFMGRKRNSCYIRPAIKTLGGGFELMSTALVRRSLVTEPRWPPILRH